jgi:hypothetical protein
MWNIPLIVLVAVAFRATGYDAFIDLYDSNKPYGISHGGNLDQSSAKLVLERRMMASQSSLLQPVSEETVELLDQFGGHQVMLFGAADEPKSPRRTLVVFDGLDSVMSTFTKCTVNWSSID